MDTLDKEAKDLIKMIDEKMGDGVSRLSVGFSENQKESVKEAQYFGKRDSWDPWPWGESAGGISRHQG